MRRDAQAPVADSLVLVFLPAWPLRLEKAYDWYSFKVLPKLGELGGQRRRPATSYLAESIRMQS